MAEKKKAYQRFEELTRQATARTPESDPNRGITGPMDSPPADMVPIRLDPEVRRALVHQAKSDGTTPSALIEEALRRYLGLPR